MSRFVSAIIVAAGGSTRMGLGYSKQFIPLCGEPAIAHTLRAFENSDIIDEVIVVCREQDLYDITTIAGDKGFDKISAFVRGGSTRDESVKNGILACDERATHFAIHDGARPLIDGEDINAVVTVAFDCGAAALGTPVTDTIKVVDGENRILSTPDRSSLRAVQTPQVFEKELYLRALENGSNKGITDDCQLVESIGESVRIVLSQRQNIKLTTQNDIKIAELILKERG